MICKMKPKMSQEKMWLEQVNKTINANTINIILNNVFV